MRILHRKCAWLEARDPPTYHRQVVDQSWTAEDNEAFASAIEAAGHSQNAVAQALFTNFGLHQRPAQATVSRWIHGAKPKASARASIRAYTHRYGPGAGPAGTPPRTRNTVDDAQAEHSQEWQERVASLSGERLLGPRQAALVDALIARLAQGPPLSDADRLAVEQIVHVVGLE